MTSSLEKPLLSVAATATVLGVPIWVADLLLDLGALSAHRVNGARVVRHRELDSLRRRRDPSWRRPTEEQPSRTGDAQEREQARRKAIMRKIDREIPRSDLIFGGRWVEVASTGELFHPWGGDVYFAPAGVVYYVDETGSPRLLEPADPPSRAEIEKRRAAKEQRRADNEAAAKERWRQLRAGAR